MPRVKKTLSAAAQKTIAKHGADFCTSAADDFSSGDVQTIGDLARLNSISFSEASAAIDAGRELLEVEASNRPETNIEFLTRIMDADMMVQLFVMDSVLKQAELVSTKPLEDVRKQFENSGAINFINPDGWHKAATDITNEFKERTK